MNNQVLPSVRHNAPRENLPFDFSSLCFFLGCIVVISLSSRATAQLTSLDGILYGEGYFSRTQAGQGVPLNSNIDGAFTLRGNGYAFDPAIAVGTFRFSLRESVQAGDTSTNAMNRAIDWYSVDATLFPRWKSNISFGSSLSETDLSVPQVGLSQQTSANVYKGITQQTRLSGRLNLGNFGWITAAGSLASTRYTGFYLTPSLQSRALTMTYGQRGEHNDWLDATYSIADNSGYEDASLGIVSDATVDYGQDLENGVFSFIGTHHTDLLGSDSRLEASSQANIDTLWRSLTSAYGSTYETSDYTQGTLQARQSFYMYNPQGLNLNFGASAGLNANYSTASYASTTWTRGENAGVDGSGNYIFYTDALRATRATAGASASAMYNGPGIPAPVNLGVSGILDHMISASSRIFGSLNASRTFTTDGPTIFAQSVSYSTVMSNLYVTLNAMHTNRFISESINGNYVPLMLDDFTSYQSISGALPSSNFQINALANERWEAWQLQSIEGLLTLTLPNANDLSSSVSYNIFIDNLSGINSQSLVAQANYHFRAVTVTGRFRYTKSGTNSWEELYLTLARPFSIL